MTHLFTQPPKKILVRMPNWLGDLVMGTPILADLRRQYPHAEITAMCQSNVAGLLIHDPHINEVYSYKRPSGWIHRGEHWSIIQEIRKGEYDLGILLTNSFSSAWWFWRGKVNHRVGFGGNGRSWLLSTAVPFPKNIEKQHLVLTYKALLEPLGILLSDTAPQLYISEEEKKEAIDLLKLQGFDPAQHKLVGINPGAAYGTAKCWLPDRFVAVSRQLLGDPSVRLIYFGDAAGAPLIQSICSELPQDRVLNLAGKTTLRELMALINQVNVFLTNDSGPMHIAAALGISLVALFGSTSDVKTGPYNNGMVIHKHVECSPCYKRVCPIDFRCMTRIETDEVYNAIIKLLT